MTMPEIKKIIETILGSGGFHVSDIEERFDDVTESTVFNVLTDDARMLIGREGETVRAFSHIVHRMIDQKRDRTSDEAYPQFSIDIDDYYQKRIQNIKNKVTILSNRARSFGVSQPMEPMSSYERLIVHHVVAEIADIESESEGMGKERHVVLKVKS